MSALRGIDLFNILMGLGNVVLLLAIRDIDHSNKVLHARNLRERGHMRHVGRRVVLKGCGRYAYRAWCRRFAIAVLSGVVGDEV